MWLSPSTQFEVVGTSRSPYGHMELEVHSRLRLERTEEMAQWLESVLPGELS